MPKTLIDMVTDDLLKLLSGDASTAKLNKALRHLAKWRAQVLENTLVQRSGDTVLDAAGCYIMPGGIDPHTHLEMPFMGTYSADDFESGTRAALSGGTTMVVDFVLPGQGQGLMDAAQMWHN